MGKCERCRVVVSIRGRWWRARAATQAAADDPPVSHDRWGLLPHTLLRQRQRRAPGRGHGEDAWIHDLKNYPDQHNDGVQSTHGLNVHIRHNRIEGASNACVQTGDESGQTTDLVIECTWLSGGGYSLNLRGESPTGTQVLRNRFTGDWGYGPWTFDDPNPTVLAKGFCLGPWAR